MSLISPLARQIETCLIQGEEKAGPSLLLLGKSLLEESDPKDLSVVADLLVRVCSHCFQAGRSRDAIELGRALAERTSKSEDVRIRRKIHNVLGAHYVDASDFTSAMQSLQTALSLAKQIGDPVIKAACLANIATLLQEMGHYRDAIEVAKQVLESHSDTDPARGLKLQCASTGLFSAHRIGDNVAAEYFLAEGQGYLPHAFGDLGRAFFEKDRALYLIDCGRHSLAEGHIEQAYKQLDVRSSNRVRVLLDISRHVCEWSCGSKPDARAALRQMREESCHTRLYHHFVLQALVKVYSDAATSDHASVGLRFAKELIEFTTSVKKAKFYRQLADRRSIRSDTSALLHSEIEPLFVARQWLAEQTVLEPAADGETVAKHEELTVIHEDIAKLRMLSIRREIRTDAVDTAENWAVAAEFFDDETGQHCYRVGHLASMLAKEIGLDDTFCIRVEHAARLHDIGKIAVNELILLKPGPLDASEMAAMRLHTEVGAQILAGSDDPTLRMATEIARHHHEWWNGRGYPAKLVGRHIPLSARVCAYADVYDALTHARAYKKAWTHERAVDEIARLQGLQFDPELFTAFTHVLDRYREDLSRRAIPGFADMESNPLIASRKKLLETIARNKPN